MTPRKRSPSSAAHARVNDVLRAYLRILQAGRNQEVIGDAIGVKRAGAGHILNGKREVQPTHLDHLCESWGIEASTLFAHLARVAQNMELGLHPGDGLRLPAAPELSAADDA